MLVQDPGDILLLERLPLHDVAPVARRVADGEEDGLVLAPRDLERFLAPGMPVDGVRGVLEKVGALLAGEAVSVRGAGHPARSIKPPATTRSSS